MLIFVCHIPVVEVEIEWMTALNKSVREKGFPGIALYSYLSSIS